jgi:hypothetical protein
MLASISPVNDSLLVLKNMPVLFTSMKNYSASKPLFDDAIYEIAEDDPEELFHSKKKFVPIMIVGLGNTVFVRQLKLIWQSQKINVKKIISGNRRINFQANFQALCVCFTHFLKI